MSCLKEYYKEEIRESIIKVKNEMSNLRLGMQLLKNKKIKKKAGLTFP